MQISSVRWQAFAVCVCLALTTAMGASDSLEDRPKFHCAKPEGRSFRCFAEKVKDLLILPLWILHTKPEYREYGEEFHVHRAPKSWTILEMRTTPNDQSEAPYDGVIQHQARAWVGTCGQKVLYAPFVEDQKPPKCP